MNDFDRQRSFDIAQQSYDNMLPPEDPPLVECKECDGTGIVVDPCDIGNGPMQCPKCKGEGEVIPEPKDYDAEQWEYEEADEIADREQESHD